MLNVLESTLHRMNECNCGLCALTLASMGADDGSIAAGGGSSSPMVAIVGAVAACVVVIAVTTIAIMCYMRRRRNSNPGPLPNYMPESSSTSPNGSSNKDSSAGSNLLHGSSNIAYDTQPSYTSSHHKSLSSTTDMYRLNMMNPSLGVLSDSQDSGPTGTGTMKSVPYLGLHKLAQSSTYSSGIGMPSGEYSTARSTHPSTQGSLASGSHNAFDAERHHWTDQWTGDGNSTVGGISVLSNSSSNTAQAVHGRVAAAVKEMQGALQLDLHEDQLQLFKRLGQGGFGTVYHGMLPVLGGCRHCLHIDAEVGHCVANCF